MKLWWPRTPAPGNFGDIFTPWLYRRIHGKAPQWHRPRQADTYCTGSSIRLAPPGATVWGSGIIDSRDKIQPYLQIRAVRGPLTRARAIECGADCPEIYGDPALLLPLYYDSPRPVTHDIGYVPHYVDLQAPPLPGALPISPLQDVEPFIDQIRSCLSIVSSSLHGLIAAEAYGIPWTHIPTHNPIGGDGVKFRDFEASLSLVDIDKLLAACPYGPDYPRAEPSSA